VNREILHARDKDGHRGRSTAGNIDVDAPAVERSGDGLSKLLVDRVRNVSRRGEVGVKQQQGDGLKAAQIHGYVPFNQRAFGNPASRWMVYPLGV
jgi:hypothetical protein